MEGGSRGPLVSPDVNLGQIILAAIWILGFGATWFFGGSAIDVQHQLAKHDAALAVEGQRITAVETLQGQMRDDFRAFMAEMRQGIKDIQSQQNELLKASRGDGRH